MSTAITRTGQVTEMGVDPWQAAKAFQASGVFPNVKTEAEAYVKILAGQEIGVGPMAAMQGINLIKGKVSYSANLLGVLVKSSGRYDFKPVEHTNEICRILFLQDGEELGISAFSLADAQRAGIASGMYAKYPKAMLFARALSQGVRWYCPDVTAGAPAYVPEELGARVDSDGEVVHGEIVDPEPVSDSTPDPVQQKRADRVMALLKDAGLSKVADVAPIFEAAKVEGLEVSAAGLKARLLTLTDDEVMRLEKALGAEVEALDVPF